MKLFFFSGCVNSVKGEDDEDGASVKRVKKEVKNDEVEESTEEESEEEVRSLRKRKRKELVFSFSLSSCIVKLVIATLMTIN